MIIAIEADRSPLPVDAQDDHVGMSMIRGGVLTREPDQVKPLRMADLVHDFACVFRGVNFVRARRENELVDQHSGLWTFLEGCLDSAAGNIVAVCIEESGLAGYPVRARPKVDVVDVRPGATERARACTYVGVLDDVGH